MKKNTVILIIVFVAVMVAAMWGYNYLSKKYEPSETPVNTGESNSLQTEKDEKIEAPDFSFLDKEGNEISFSEFKGKPAVINFWATWCGPCKAELPYFEEMYEKYGDKVNFMMINLTDGQRETVDVVNDFINNEKYSFPVYFDSLYEGAYTYGVNSIPVSVFIDKDGYVIGLYRSMIDGRTLESCISALLK